MKQKNNDMDFGTVPVIVPPELGRPGYQGEEDPGYTKLAAFETEMQAEYDAQRHLTPESFAKINLKRKLLDFEIFKRANAGEVEAISAVMEYHKRELEGFLPPCPDEIELQCQQDLVRAFRQAIVKYKIHPGDTYHSYDELLNMAYDILEAETAASMK